MALDKKVLSKTNDEFVKYLMTFSKYGALSQLFIIDAITKHAEAVAASTPADYSKDCFVHPESWIGVAKEIKDAFEQRNKRT